MHSEGAKRTSKLKKNACIFDACVLGLLCWHALAQTMKQLDSATAGNANTIQTHSQSAVNYRCCKPKPFICRV